MPEANPSESLERAQLQGLTDVNGTSVRDLRKVGHEAVWFGKVTVCGSDFYAYLIAV